MPRKKSFLSVTDQFCGAGGSSQGVRRLAERKGGGLEVSLAMNHWKLAIETHNTNFPDTLHDCTDISAADPRRYPSTDILITSPECTTHSPAGGNTHKQLKKQMSLYDTGKIDAATERSRATMWDVCRFAEYHNYNAIVVENVIEAKLRWALFDNWLGAMRTLGYEHECCFFNSMHFWPTPQSRDRMYVVFWKKGNRKPNLNFTPLAWCAKCSADIHSVQTWKNSRMRVGKFDKQYVFCCPGCATKVTPYYFAAFNCIDWTNIGSRIGDRPRPLRTNTLARIQYGLDRYGNDPLLINNRHSTGISYRVRNAITGRLDTIDTQPHLTLCTPLIIKTDNTKRTNGSHVKKAIDGLPTQTTLNATGVVLPYIVDYHKHGQAKTPVNPFSTITAGGLKHGLLSPMVVQNKGESKARSSNNPLPSCTTINSLGIVTDESWNSFLSSYNGGSHCIQDVHEAAGSITTKDRLALTTFKKPHINDCYYRMLVPEEIKLAMAFDPTYKVLGNSRNQVKQCGNAVTPPVMEWIIERVIESLN